MKTELGNTTRLRLVDAALRSFAEDSVEKASLLDIARQAGQRNRGAVHYHFGSRQGLLVAVLDQYAAQLGDRRAELLGDSADEDTVASVVDAVIRPVVELGDTGWRGRCYLVVIADVSLADPGSWDPEIAEVLEVTGGREVYLRLGRLMPPLPAEVVNERLWLVAAFVLHTVAIRARSFELVGARAQLDTPAFLANLAAMVTGMVTAPAP